MSRTVASLALVRINWENKEYRKDFIEIFVPFIVTLISKKDYREIDVNTICKDFGAEYGLCIPYHPMISILNRVQKRGFIKKGNRGSIIPIKEKIEEGDFSKIALEQERKYKKVITRFTEYCKEHHKYEMNENVADEAFISFLKDHDLDILFSCFSRATLLPDVNSSISEQYLINRFMTFTYEQEQELFDFIVDISYGHIIANTILHKDYQRYQGKLIGNYYLDIGILFNLFGINGPDKKQAYVEFIELLKQNGSKVMVFQHNYEEFLGILESCMTWVDSQYFDPSKASRALLYFRDNEFTALDIERFINKVPGELNKYGITLINLPNFNENWEYQISEEELTNLIVHTYKENAPSFDEEGKEFTIYQDVKSASAILKLRRGDKPLKIADAKHVYVTTNASFAYSIRQFEQKLYQVDGNVFFFIPCIITDVFIGTLVWMHSPAIVQNINQKRLIANAYAAQQPNRTTMKRFVDTVEKLRQEGSITEDEVTTLKASRVARNLLQEDILGDPDRFSTKTVYDVLEEYKSRILAEQRRQFDNERQQILIIEQQKEQELQTKTSELHEKENELDTTKLQLKNETLTRMLYERNINQVTGLISKIVAIIIYVSTFFIIVLACLYQFYPSLMGDNAFLKWFFSILGLILTIFSFFNGFNIAGLKNRIETLLQTLFRSFFYTNKDNQG